MLHICTGCTRIFYSLLNICCVVLFSERNETKKKHSRKMRVHYSILILFSCYNLAKCFAFPSDVEDEMERESEHDEGEQLISEDGNGLCTFEITKYERKNTVVQYYDVVTFIGRCRGSYFRRCVNERSLPKTRYEERVEPTKTHMQKCCTGYTPAIDSPNKCVPVCEPACEFGTCTSPNNCSCHEGYTKHQTEPNICVAECHGCEYGVCLEPNLCQCYQNYDWDTGRLECVPFCSGTCHNGKCVAPEKCVCDAGYIHHESESICIPHCMNACENGVCISPDLCVCSDGYAFANETHYLCEPICEIECINSKCVEPNTCECEDGYVAHDDTKPHECICGKYCVEVDGKCHCLDAKQRVSVKDFGNYTLCSRHNCANGYCKTPMECECFDGFEKDENSICAPANETCIDDPTLCGATEISTCDCINGICSLNGTCNCLNGFKMVADHNDRCEPHCSKECVNGVCVDPDTCLCENEINYHLGYNESEWNICYPICDRDMDDTNGCYNGTCVEPGICKCFDGFKLDSNANFTCKPIQIEAHSSSNVRFVSISIIVFVAILSGLTYMLYIAYQRKLLQKPNYDDQRRPIANEMPTDEL